MGSSLLPVLYCTGNSVLYQYDSLCTEEEGYMIMIGKEEEYTA